MAHKKITGVQQIATGTGTGDLTLDASAASPIYRTVQDAGMSDGDTMYAMIRHATIQSEWEIALVTYNSSGTTISRTFDSKSVSATGALISFTDGVKIVVEARHDGVDWIREVGKTTVQAAEFGAVGDNVADDTAALQAAIDFVALTGGRVLELQAGATYKTTDILTVANSNFTVRGHGATIDGSAIPASASFNVRHAFLVTGAIDATETDVASDIAVGDKQIEVDDTTGYAAGDIILLKSSAEEWPEGSTTSSSSLKGMVHRIGSIDDGTHLSLMDGSLFSFTAATTTIQKITPVDGVVFDDVNIVMGGVDSNHCGVLIYYFTNCWFRGGSIRGGEDANIRFAYGIGGGVLNADLSDATSPANGSSGSSVVSGYGAHVYSAARDISISGCQLRSNRHGVSGSGSYPNAFVDVENNHVDGSVPPAPGVYNLECHEECLYWAFRANKIAGNIGSSGSGGLMIRGQYCTAEGNHIVNASQYAILVQPFGTHPDGMNGNSVANNTIVGARLVGIYVLGTVDAFVKNVTIKGNQVRGCPEGIRLNVTRGATVSDNTLEDCGSATTAALRLFGSSTTDDHCSDVVLSGNRINGAPQYGVLAVYAERLSIFGQMVTAVNSPMRFENSQDVVISGGYYETTGTAVNAIIFVVCTDVVASGGRVHASAGSSGAGFFSSGASENISVIGPRVSGFNRGFSHSDAPNNVVTAYINDVDCSNPVFNGAAKKIVANNLKSPESVTTMLQAFNYAEQTTTDQVELQIASLSVPDDSFITSGQAIIARGTLRCVNPNAAASIVLKRTGGTIIGASIPLAVATSTDYDCDFEFALYAISSASQRLVVSVSSGKEDGSANVANQRTYYADTIDFAAGAQTLTVRVQCGHDDDEITATSVEFWRRG